MIAGNGPCNAERIAARQKAHNDGAWVRDAASAYAKKQSRRKKLEEETQDSAA